jgi:hypothetical protein
MKEKNMNIPLFAQEQQDWICYKIDEWYLHWNNYIVNCNIEDNLGDAKEQLKRLICPLHPSLSPGRQELMNAATKFLEEQLEKTLDRMLEEKI